jgi:hypothetical protein
MYDFAYPGLVNMYSGIYNIPDSCTKLGLLFLQGRGIPPYPSIHINKLNPSKAIISIYSTCAGDISTPAKNDSGTSCRKKLRGVYASAKTKAGSDCPISLNYLSRVRSASMVSILPNVPYVPGTTFSCLDELLMANDPLSLH